MRPRSIPKPLSFLTTAFVGITSGSKTSIVPCPSKVKVRFADSPEVRKILGEVLKKYPDLQIVSVEGVRSIEYVETGLVVLTASPSHLFEHVSAMAAKGGPDVNAMEPLDEDLEAVFRYLTQ